VDWRLIVANFDHRMNTPGICAVESDLRSHERQQEQEIKRDRAQEDFYEMHTWSEILDMAGADADEILAALYEGHHTVAKHMMDKAFDRAWERRIESQH
jgi:hypothetical protein